MTELNEPIEDLIVASLHLRQSADRMVAAMENATKDAITHIRALGAQLERSGGVEKGQEP